MKMDFSYWSRKIIVFLPLFIFFILPYSAKAQNIYVLGNITQAQTQTVGFTFSNNIFTENIRKNLGISGGYNITMDSRTNVIFVSTDGSNKIRYFSALNLNFINESQEYPSVSFAGIAFDNSRSKLYAISKYTNRIYIFSWNPVAKTLNLDGGVYISLQNAHQGLSLAVDEANGLLYVADRTDNIKIYRTSDMAYSGQLKAGVFAANVAVDSKNQILYAGAGSPTGTTFLSKVNILTSAETKIDIGSPVLSIAIDDKTSNVFVTTYNYGPMAGSLVVYTSALQYVNHVPNLDPYGVCVAKAISSPNPIRLSISTQSNLDGFFEPGDTIIYQVCYDNVNNPGVQATNVILIDSLPAELEHISHTGNGLYSSAAHQITWNIGSIFGGAQQSCFEIKARVKTTVQPGTNIMNYAKISSNEIPYSFATKTSLVQMQSVQLLTPAGGELYVPGSKIPITWNSVNASFVQLSYSTNGTTFALIPGAENLPAVPASFTWTAPQEVSGNCLIKVSSATKPIHFSISSSPFTILDPALYSIKALSPNGGERWISGESKSISVSAAKDIQNLKIEYSTNSGETWLQIDGFNSVPKGNALNWLVPKSPSPNCLIKVSSVEIPAIYDISDAVFSIVGLDLTSPDGGERYTFKSVRNITWRSNEINSMRIEYSTNNGASWNTIENSYPANAKFYSWSVPNAPSELAKVRIRDNERSSIYDVSNEVFTINSLLLLSPIGGETWLSGTVQEIKWEFGEVSAVKLEFTTDNGVRWITIESNYPAAAKSYLWTTPKTQSTQCYIRISSVENPSVFDISPSAFEIRGTGIKLLSPAGGENWETGVKHNILWSSVNVDFIDIEYTVDGGVTWETIAERYGAGFGKYDWIVPNYPSVECMVRLTDSDNGDIKDSSAIYFRIGGYPYMPPGSWRFQAQTGNNSVVLLPRVIDPKIGNRSFVPGDAVGVFYLRKGESVCGGYAKWQDGQNLAITVWGDNPRTTLKDGFDVNEKYVFKIWDAVEGREILAEATFEALYSSNPDRYDHDKISIIKTFKSHSELTINLPGNLWSLISSNIIPYPPGIESVMSEITSSLDYMKNDRGDIYHPGENVNSITNWNITDGYQINMKDDAVLTIRGTRADVTATSMNFAAQKWYIIAYLPQYSMPINTALETIQTKILMVKNSAGKIYFPQYNINHIVNMVPGEGYKLSVSLASTLIYPQYSPKVYSEEPPFGKFPDIPLSGRYAPKFSETGNSAVIIIESAEIPDGSEIGVITASGIPVGNAYLQNKSAVITVWGDNPATGGIIEGAINDERMFIRYQSADDGREYNAEIRTVANMLTGKPDSKEFKYKQDAVWLAQSGKGSPAASVVSANAEGVVSIEPNPVKDIMTIRLNLTIDTPVKLTLYNALGKAVGYLIDDSFTAGEHIIRFNASQFQSGAYFYVLSACDKTATGKLIIAK